MAERAVSVKGGEYRGDSRSTVLLLTAGEVEASFSWSTFRRGAGMVCVGRVGSAIEGRTAGEPPGDESSSGSIVVVRLGNSKACDRLGHENLVL